MHCQRTVRRVSIALFFVLIAALTASAQTAQNTSQLGRIEFPTSGSAEAQQHFLRGVAAMHSFWYEEVLEAFRAATKADPTFAMGYWDEAMTYNHPIWQQADANLPEMREARQYAQVSLR
ncbi:MAG TPA: hypothetical protein VNQ79_17355 [Blastocatellia bacterium]|nr:hypothetical protein [Blastocatellia bacterium]